MLTRNDATGVQTLTMVEAIRDAICLMAADPARPRLVMLDGDYEGYPALAAAYGVEVPGADGRAGMAAVLMQEGAALDGEALYALVGRTLPPYARPAFVRELASPDLTATFKIRKVALQREGFALARSSDPVYYRNDRDEQYVPLTSDAIGAIERGEIRF